MKKNLALAIVTLIFVFLFSASLAAEKRVPIGDVQLPLTASGRPVAVYVDGIGRITAGDQAMGLGWAEKPIASVKDAPSKFRWKPEHMARVELAPRAWPVGSECGLTTLRLYSVEAYDAETIVRFDTDGDGRLSVAEVQAVLFACIWPTEVFSLTGGYTTAMTEDGVVALVVEISGVKLEIRRIWRQQAVINGVVVQLAQPEMAWAWGLSSEAVKAAKKNSNSNGTNSNSGSNSGSNSNTTPAPTSNSNTPPSPANTPNPEHDKVLLPPKAEAESQGQTSQQSSSAAEPNPQYDNVVKPERVSSQVEVVSGNATTTSWTVSEAQSQAQPVAVVEAKTASTPTVTFTVQDVQETKSVSASVSEAKASGTETGVTVAPEPRHDSSGLPARVPAE